ncbi:MAG TPA: hypothetical protein VJ802_18100 [Gemmatimonadaceae bacterium]|nr:hypothetical protein [Gemmatimonadaceae bacterium]
MTIATEVRWFWKGELDHDLERWFRSAKELLGDAIPDSDLDNRTDHYLVEPESSEYGLKLREEKLELKRMLDSSLFRAPRTGVTGIAQLWTKDDWTYTRIPTRESSDAVVQAFLGGSDAADIASVRKRRWQRKYVPRDDGTLERVGLREKLARACNVELTGLTFEGPWWTIAFEAYGDTTHPGTLANTVDWFFERFASPRPRLENSESYPQWISRASAGA